MPAEPILAAILVLAAIVDVLIQFLSRSATFWLIPRLLKSNLSLDNPVQWFSTDILSS